jgi:hypothetical protein
MSIEEDDRDGPDYQAGQTNRNVSDDDKPGKKTRLVQRATALRGLSANPPQVSTRARRKIAERDLIKNSNLPMEDYGKDLRKILCSMAERQDRLNEDLLLRIRDLEYRVEDLEYDHHPDYQGGP